MWGQTEFQVNLKLGLTQGAARGNPRQHRGNGQDKPADSRSRRQSSSRQRGQETKEKDTGAKRKAKAGRKRKRDGYDIDKMGSFGLWFGDATNSAGRSWWNGFHVLNRGVARMQLFEKAADYQAFEQVLLDTLDQSPMRICAYAVMPNHWHLLLWPECDGELAAFMQRLTITHVRRWQEHRGYAGLGHVYQGRYKSFPVESDEHFWVVARYVERNALRANLVLRAEEWRWSSLWQRCHPTGEERSLLAAWPIDMPANWLERVNQTDDAQELEALRRSVQRGRPFGQPEWQKEIAQRLGLESAYRPTGRPRKVGRNQNMPRPGEDRSDVGGAAQFTISDLSRFPLSSPGPVPLSSPNSVVEIHPFVKFIPSGHPEKR